MFRRTSNQSINISLRSCPILLVLLLIITAAACYPTQRVFALDGDPFRAKELERFQREYEQNMTAEDELYQYEKSGRISEKDYKRLLEYVDSRQDITPLTFGDRYFKSVFWTGYTDMDSSLREQLPNWMQSQNYLEQRKAGKDLERVGPAEDASMDDVRVTYGPISASERAAYGHVQGYGRVGFKGYEKFDRRTQKWYPSEGKKNYSTGKMEYGYTQEGRALMQETIRRDTIRRIGSEKYKELMEHARKRTPDYKIAEWDKQEKRKRIKANVQVGGLEGKNANEPSKPGVQPGQRQSEKERQKEMERKAEAQQKKEAERPPVESAGNAGKGVPVIPETCVIDIAFWDPQKPDNKNHGFLCLRDGRYRLEMEQKCDGFTKNKDTFHPSEYRHSWEGQLRDNVITGTETAGHTKPNRTTYRISDTTPCSTYSSSEGRGSFTITFHLEGRLEMRTSWHYTDRFWSSSPQCGKENQKSSSRSHKYEGIWSIRKKNTGSTEVTYQSGRCTVRSYCP